MNMDSSEPMKSPPAIEPFGRLWYRDPYGGSVGVTLPPSSDLREGGLSDLRSGEDTWPIPSDPDDSILVVPSIESMILLPYLTENWGEGPVALAGCRFFSPERRGWVKPDFPSVLERLLEETAGPFENIIDPCPALEFFYLNGTEAQPRFQSLDYGEWRVPNVRGRMNLSFPAPARRALKRLLNRVRERGFPPAESERTAGSAGEDPTSRTRHQPAETTPGWEVDVSAW